MDRARVKNDGYDSKATVTYFGVAWLAHVISRQAVLHIQVDIKDIMHVVVLNESLQFLVLAANVLKVLWIQPLFGEVDEYTPAPVLTLISALYLDSNQPARHQKRHDVLRLPDKTPDLCPYFLLLLSEVLLLPDQFLLGNGTELLELGEFLR